MTSVSEMRQHVFDLWGEDEIEWCQRPSQANAMREAGVIRIAPIKSVFTYATALHEIGHIHGRHQQSSDVVVRERWAWHWAKTNALIWTPAMERYMQAAIDWYVKRQSKKG